MNDQRFQQVIAERDEARTAMRSTADSTKIATAAAATAEHTTACAIAAATFLLHVSLPPHPQPLIDLTIEGHPHPLPVLDYDAYLS